MSRTPVTVAPDMLAAEALHLLEERRDHRARRRRRRPPVAGRRAPARPLAHRARVERRVVLADYLPFISALLALLAGVAIGKAWERYKLRDGRWIDRRKARDSHHYVLGLNYLVANQIDLAIEELSQAARVDADALEIHLILGNVYRERGQVSRAIQVHQSLLQRQKLTRLEHAYVMLCLGLDYKRGGFVDRAVEAFKEARRLDPANAYALLHLEKVYEEQRQWEEAATRTAGTAGHGGPGVAGAQPDHSGLPRERTWPDRAQGRRSAPLPAPASRRHSISTRTVTPASVNLGDVLARDGRTDEAVRLWEGVMDEAPDRVASRRSSGSARPIGRPGSPTASWSCAGGSPRRTRTTGGPVWRSAHALADAGQRPAALDQFLEALSHNPHGLTVHEAIWDLLLATGLERTSVERYVDARPGRRVLPRPARVPALSLSQHGTPVAVPALPRVEYVRRGTDRAGHQGRQRPLSQPASPARPAERGRPCRHRSSRRRSASRTLSSIGHWAARRRSASSAEQPIARHQAQPAAWPGGRPPPPPRRKSAPTRSRRRAESRRRPACRAAGRQRTRRCRREHADAPGVRDRRARRHPRRRAPPARPGRACRRPSSRRRRSARRRPPGRATPGPPPRAPARRHRRSPRPACRSARPTTLLPVAMPPVSATRTASPRRGRGRRGPPPP